MPLLVTNEIGVSSTPWYSQMVSFILKCLLHAHYVSFLSRGDIESKHND